MMISHDLSHDYGNVNELDVSRRSRRVVEVTDSMSADNEVISETVTEEFVDGKTVRRVVVRKRVRLSTKESDIYDGAVDMNNSVVHSPVSRSQHSRYMNLSLDDQVRPLHDLEASRDINGDIKDSSIYEPVLPRASVSASGIAPDIDFHEHKAPALADDLQYEELDRSRIQPSLYESVTCASQRISFPTPIDGRSYSERDDEVLEGEGIKEGTVGQPIQFTLNGRRAGPGQLSCRCRAPSGIMTYVGIHDNKDGTYTVDLNATEPGLHTVEVEWDGQPIPGSPFLVRIMQAPDVKKVRAHGSGLESGLINSFQGVFKVETKGAGPGTLKIRIHGPKGAFKVEMSRDHPKDRTINVKYNPTEPGIYTANVFWSDEHVQGSPFEIFVAQDAEHLRKWENNREHIHQQEGLMNGH